MKWKKMAFIFCILQVGFFVIIGIQKNNNLTNFAVAIWLITYVAGIVLSFIVRKEYLIRLDVLSKTDVDDEEIQDLKDKIVSEYQSEGIIDEPVQKYHHVELNKKNQKEEVFHAGKVVDQPKLDINSCSELDFINLPGFNTLMAKEAGVYRKTHHGFSSVDEFFNVLNISPHLVVQIQDKIVCNLVQKDNNDAMPLDKTNRKLDF